MFINGERFDSQRMMDLYKKVSDSFFEKYQKVSEIEDEQERIYYKCHMCKEKFKNSEKAVRHARRAECIDPVTIIRQHTNQMDRDELLSGNERKALFNLQSNTENVISTICHTFDLYKSNARIENISSLRQKTSYTLRNDLKFLAVKVALTHHDIYPHYNRYIIYLERQHKINLNPNREKAQKGIESVLKQFLKNQNLIESFCKNWIVENNRKIISYYSNNIRTIIRNNDWESINYALYYGFINIHDFRNLVTEYIIEINSGNEIFDYFFDKVVGREDTAIPKIEDRINEVTFLEHF